ncbi:MBL fold metallo-hydrolase [Nocardia terpenica]|uniref:rhodanese-like domain-containing protein n=1 Tax=Nocardia terpenica TaxID=455432 RepID=UPI0018949088|nr:rhodanese-like domain-containing protein [Nocardia terpenica]MBF6061984.1 MBL fold metallo-hydrolase [Nocardia terpenica]MBF6106216.1 MBL fold metallo-hydrolase [Nocardia terpenica]MBF6110404.1 MBL fold metallo-hydrolase [Nocardia terpenica]MBF6120759.1 MBL fold metallo-hydrolase [Nocardia terpenica]MBF6151740.1 MBL fold metallo-hydrolase [Nocardia terpenica]
MILKQFYLSCLSHASYLIADEQSRRAIIVDPRRDIDEYLDTAARHGLRIEGVINTHFHADFLSGHLELVAATGAWIGFGAAAETDYPIRRLSHGEHLSLGRVDIEILATPGHTWESISLLVRDGISQIPAAVLTGDSLFIGDVGRPDLANLSNATSTDLARAMYNSIHRVLLRLPDEVAVMPAHGAGSSCGKNLSTDLVSTIGEQRRTNPSVQPMTEDEFVALITSGQPAIPGYFHSAADLNRRIHPVLDSARTVPELCGNDIRARMTDPGTVLIDTRSPEEFAAAHLTGSVNVGLAGRFAETCGMVANADDSILVITAPGDEQQAVLRLGRIGYDNVAGYLNARPDTGSTFPESLADLVEHTDRITVTELADLLDRDAVTVLDVRNGGERESGFIEGSLHIPLPELAGRHREVPDRTPVVVHCQSGWRSSVAASLLRAHEHRSITDLEGGYLAWSRLHRKAL